jgi:hypothetical protein
MEDQQHEDAPPANNRAVKLPPFWTANPRAWFASAEGAFQLRNIADERSRFFNCLHALTDAKVCLIADLVEADPLPENPYMELRRRLLAAHQLTDIQRVEQLHNLPPLGSQKPSELLAEMLRLCPRGQENNAFFNCLFLNRWPGSSASCCRRRTWRTSRRWAPGPTSSPPTTASRPTMWWQQWLPFLFRIKKGRRPQWPRSAQVAAGSGAAAGSPRRSRDAVAVPVAAADSRPHTR